MKIQILAVDDTQVILDLLVHILTSQGYEVDRAGNGIEGLKMACEKQYDLIISDMDMPVMRGIEFYKELLKKMPWMKHRILFVTANADRETELCIREHGLKHLPKPFRASELLEAIHELIKPHNTSFGAGVKD